MMVVCAEGYLRDNSAACPRSIPLEDNSLFTLNFRLSTHKAKISIKRTIWRFGNRCSERLFSTYSEMSVNS